MNKRRASTIDFAERRDTIGYLAFLLYSIILMIFSFIKGVGSDYILTFAVVLCVCSIMYLWTAKISGDNLLAFPLAIIIMTGSYIQVYLALEAGTLGSSRKSYTLYILVGLIVFLAVVFVMTRKISVICFLYSYQGVRILMCATCILYLITIIWNIAGQKGNVGQVKNWISIMGISVQMTDITRLMYIWILAVSAKRINNIKWFRLVALNYFLNVIFLIIASELGFIILISIVTAIVMALYLDDLAVVKKTFGKRLKPVVIIAAVIILLGIIFHRLLYNLMLRSSIGVKIIDRFTLFIDPENVSPDLAYQYNLVKTAIYNGGLFGNKNLSAVVPVGESDLIFSNIVQYFGLIIGMIVVLLLSVFYISLLVKCRRNTQSSVGQIFTLSLFSQTLFNIGATIGVFPLAGVTLPFLSLGGTSFVLSFLSIGIILGAGSVKYPYSEFESIGKEEKESNGSRERKKISDLVNDFDSSCCWNSDSVSGEIRGDSGTFQNSGQGQSGSNTERKTGKHDFWNDL